MKTFFGCFAVIGAMLCGHVAADNNDPVVLVHGLAAFAETWMYRSVIEDEGLTTFAVDIGKFSSAWARACETYAQLKGTRVDYGVCHSQQNGNGRWGRDYTGQGMYPEWDENHKVHLWAHSLGGPTVTAIERILRQGSGCPQDTSPFFTGGKNWITSVTTMSGVLGGTTLVDILDTAHLLDAITGLIVGLGGLLDNTLVDKLYDIQFDQWGLTRAPGESLNNFWDRVEASGILSPNNQDISTYDLSIAGARANNAQGPLEYSDTYYFAFATERTHPSLDCKFVFWCKKVEDPDLGMFIFLQPTGNWIGSDSPSPEMKNDGLVNWNNQHCPIVQDSDRNRCNEYNGNWPIGQWVYYDVNYLDHIQIIIKDPVKDALNYAKSAKKIYVDHARRVKALPSTSA